MKRFVGPIITSVIVVLVILGPQIYLQHKRLTEHQREFMLMEVKSLESSLGVCKVIMESTRPDLQESRDVMRGVCDRMKNDLVAVNKKLENW
jgi:hypothetical protein